MERFEFEASNTKLEHEICRHCEESALKLFTSYGRLASQLKTNEIGKVGKLVMKIESSAPKIGKLVKKNEMGDPKVGKVGKSIRFHAAADTAFKERRGLGLGR